ncbi:MAG: Ig-like domain-containing protein, partial [Burkholderiaceae bacterium]
AQTNTIAYNRFSSTPPSQSGSTASGQPSYEIDLPNGGTSYVIGNVIEQPAVNQNPALLAYGEEGATNSANNLYVVNNTFLNDNTFSGTFVMVGSTVTAPVLLQNNIFAGVGTVSTQASAISKNNYSALNPPFVNRVNYDLHPAPGSPMIDAGSAPGTAADGTALTPVSQYKHVAGIEARPVSGTIDIGAYEVASSGGGTTTTTTTSTTGNSSSTTAGTTSTTANTTTTTLGNTTSTTSGKTTTTTTSTTTTTAMTSPDTIPPVVGFNSPVEGAQVSGKVAISVTATDNRAVANLVLLIDGQQVSSTNSSTINYTWDATRVRGRHTLSATAYDTTGNKSSVTITVRVSR